MTSREITELLHAHLDGYSYVPPEGVLGVPFSNERVASELALLRSSLVQPELRRVVLRDTADQLQASPPIVRTAWVVALAPNGVVILYYPADSEFGLAYENSLGELETIGVRGDLVGTFMAR